MQIHSPGPLLRNHSETVLTIRDFAGYGVIFCQEIDLKNDTKAFHNDCLKQLYSLFLDDNIDYNKFYNLKFHLFLFYPMFRFMSELMMSSKILLFFNFLFFTIIP